MLSNCECLAMALRSNKTMQTPKRNEGTLVYNHFGNSALRQQASLCRSRVAASPVIATLLILAVVISSSILTYVWSLGLMANLMGGGGSQTKEQLIMESYDWTTPNPKVVMRNVGVSSVVISRAYVAAQVVSELDGLVLEPGKSSQAVSLGFTGSLGTSYVLKVISATGGIFVFVMIAGSSG